MGVSPIQASHRIESNDATHRIQFMRSRTQYRADDDSFDETVAGVIGVMSRDHDNSKGSALKALPPAPLCRSAAIAKAGSIDGP